MQLEHRCFSGNTFRPKPEIIINEQLQMFAIVTPWGKMDQTQPVLDFLTQNYESFTLNKEKTNIYKKLQSLSEEENTLRCLVMSCNTWIFNEQNMGKEYMFAYELVCGSLKDGKLSLVQIGQPFIYLDRPHVPLQSMGHILDLAGLFSVEKRLPPLPSQLIGLYPDASCFVFSFPLHKEDRFVFIARDFVPGSILDTPRTKRNLNGLLELLSQENEESPLWLGILSF